ncbi:MAG TPA: hypothetical protein GX011_00955 [Clostridiales bacterium]|nr:hypothetical protein [Clostridiales bacterium]
MPRKEGKKKRRDDEFDDGRTIANMNVDGMPWYNGKIDKNKPGVESDSVNGGPEKITLTKKEERALLRGVVLAALLAGGVFFVVFAAFVLFCIYVWFR